MNITNVDSQRPLLFIYKKITDDRGSLIKISDNSQDTINQENFFSDVYVAESKRNTFRGLHYQVDEHGQRKKFLVLSGHVTFYCMNIETSEILDFDLNANSKTALYVPFGWATGYHAKHNYNQVFYASPDPYIPSAERVISCLVIKKLDRGILLLSPKDAI
jgi:dTDP-4-dehydrorhamnose 3,5-epimerase-like enzyme